MTLDADAGASGEFDAHDAHLAQAGARDLLTPPAAGQQPADPIPAGSCHVRLRPMPSAPQAARVLTRQYATSRRMPAAVIDDAVYLAGELVRASIRRSGSVLELIITTNEQDLVVRVRDEPRAAAGAILQTGRGTDGDFEAARRVAHSYGYCNHDVGAEFWASVRLRRRAGSRPFRAE